MLRFLRPGVRRSGALIAALPLLLGTLVLLGGSSRSAEAADGPVPGLPFLPCPTLGPEYPEGTVSGCADYPDPDDYVTNSSWLNFPQIGLAGSPKAKQWTKVPLSMMAASILFHTKIWPDAGPGNKVQNEFWYDIKAFFVSPAGSARPYGDSAPIPVRTVAFGSIPVEVTLQVQQRRSADGNPEPLQFRPHDYKIARAVGDTAVVDAATLEANVTIAVKSITVDGVDTRLRGTCRTGRSARLHLESKELRVDQPERQLEAEVFDPEIYQYGIYGGTLNGSLSIPAFAGCATATGDDLSPLLTSALSEDGAPISVRLGATNCQIYDDANNNRPIPAGVNNPRDPRAGCFDSTYENPKVVTVPKPFDLPDYAPGQSAP